MHHHAVRRALDDRLLEFVCSPMSTLGGESGARLARTMRCMRGWISDRLGREPVQMDSFPVFDAEGAWTSQGGATDIAPGTIGNGITRVDLDLSDTDHPAVTYRCAEVGGMGMEVRRYQWNDGCWELGPVGD